MAGITHSRDGHQARRRRSLAPKVSGTHLLVVLAGVVGMVLTLTALRNADTTVGVVALVRDVRSGASVSLSDLTTVRIHADQDVLRTLVLASDTRSVIASIALGELHRGDMLRASDVRVGAASSRLRSISIALDAADAVDGTLRAGDRIDIIGVNHDGSQSGFVAGNTLVLSVDAGNTTGPLRSSATRITMTLGVDGATAVRLIAAQASGHVVMVNATGAAPLNNPTMLGQPTHA